MKWRVAAAVALIVVGAGAVGFVILGPSFGPASPRYLTALAAATDVVDEVVGTGSIAPNASYSLSFGAVPTLTGSTSASGTGGSSIAWPVEAVAVTVGQQVKAGDVLATADATDAKTQLAINRATLKAAEARLVADEAGATPAQRAAAENAIASAELSLSIANGNVAQTKQSNQLSVASAQNALADAKAALASAEAGPTSDVKAAAQDQVDAAQRSLDQAIRGQSDAQAQNDLAISQAQKAVDDAYAAWTEAWQKLTNDEARGASAATLAADQSAADAALKARTNAEGSLESAKLKATSGNEQAAAQVASAQAALATAKRQYATNTTPSSAAIEAARQKVRDAELNLTSAKQRASAATASQVQQLQQAGVQLSSANTSRTSQTTPLESALASDAVSVANARAAVATSQATVNRATIVAPADGTIVTVNIHADVVAPSGSAIVMHVGPYQVTANFSESSLAKVAVGQVADVTVTATGTTSSGKVTVIGATPATGGTSSVVTYPITVALDREPDGVQVGMTAEVAIIIAQASNVIAVSTQALRGASGAYTVRTIDAAGTITEVPVAVGLVTTSMAEVKSGLSGGETVITGTVSALTSSSSSGNGGDLLPGGGFPGGDQPGGGGTAP